MARFDSLGISRSFAIALASTLLGALCFGVTFFFWQRTANVSVNAPATSLVLMQSFESREPPAIEVDLANAYGGRVELLDPARALPAWQKFSTEDAVLAHAATLSCTAQKPLQVTEPELVKMLAWHDAVCGHDRTRLEDLAGAAPFLHPSGRTYARLALDVEPRVDAAWIRLHKRAFHVLELRVIDAALLDDADRALASVTPHAWSRVLAGDATVITDRWILHVSRDAFGPARLAFRPRATWDAYLASASGRNKLRALLVASAALVALGLIFMGISLVRARREADRERVFLLRTLTHELRTPTTAMRLDVEPLRAAFDDLPDDCQEPLLRLVEGVERMSRVLEVTGRVLSLFESQRNGGSASVVHPREVASLRTYFEELREEWPEGVTLALPKEDAPLFLDPDWLRVAIRNLVANGVTHGVLPVAVVVRVESAVLVVRVSDAGKTPDFSLKDAALPFHKDEKSAGLGLGLSLVQRIVTLSGGRLRHEAEPTTFDVRMPARNKKNRRSERVARSA